MAQKAMEEMMSSLSHDVDKALDLVDGMRIDLDSLEAKQRDLVLQSVRYCDVASLSKNLEDAKRTTEESLTSLQGTLTGHSGLLDELRSQVTHQGAQQEQRHRSVQDSLENSFNVSREAFQLSDESMQQASDRLDRHRQQLDENDQRYSDLLDHVNKSFKEASAFYSQLQAKYDSKFESLYEQL